MARPIRRLKPKTKNSTMSNNTYVRMISVRDVLALDPYESSVDAISGTIRRLRKKEREHVLSICKKVVNNDKIGLRRNDAIRVAAIKVIVAAAPHSAKIIQRIIRNKSDRNAYELHFTLFCFLDQLRNIPNARQLSHLMLSHVRGYLQDVKYDTARAAWMGGDLLGEHWPLEESLPVLIQVAREAKYAVGREAAVEGLEKAFKRVDASSAHRRQILSLLRDVSVDDRSDKVRRAARYVLQKSLPRGRARGKRMLPP